MRPLYAANASLLTVSHSTSTNQRLKSFQPITGAGSSPPGPFTGRSRQSQDTNRRGLHETVPMLFRCWLLACLCVASAMELMFVTEVPQLQQAVRDGVAHIIIRQNLDMRGLDPDPESSSAGALLSIRERTKSIRGDCASAAPLQNVTLDTPVSILGQCVITVDSPAIEVDAEGSQLLLSHVYFQLDRTPQQKQASMVTLLSVSSDSVWLMRVGFRGDETQCRAVDVAPGLLMHAHLSFPGFSADESAAVRLSARSKAGFKDCVFNLNKADGYGATIGIGENAASWLESCTLSTNSDLGTLKRSDTQYSGISQAEGSTYINDRAFQYSLPLGGVERLDPIPITTEELNRLGFLATRVDSFQQIAEDQTRLTNLQPVPIESIDPESSSSDDSSGIKMPMIIGVVCAAVVVVLSVAGVIVLYRRRRARRKLLRSQLESSQKTLSTKPSHIHHPYINPGPHPYAGGVADGTPMHEAGPAPALHDMHTAPSLHLQHHAAAGGGRAGSPFMDSDQNLLSPNVLEPPTQSSHHTTLETLADSRGRPIIPRPQSRQTAGGTQQQFESLDGVTGTWFSTISTVRPVRPGPGASFADRKAFLNFQLDSLYQKHVLTRFVVLDGMSSRRQGGQAVVQIAEDERTRIQYAMKFFLTDAAFLDEKALYLDPDQPLGKFLPDVHSIVEAGEAKMVDAYGGAMPPCIVMEKGESLDVWAASTGDGLDMVTGLQVITHIAERLSDLHAAGYVHRDIKPGNVMWLPRKKRWTLIDFGCVARSGEQAPTGFSFTYAAPETLLAHMAGARSIHVSEAIDAWSVGILAIEIFTGQPVFNIFQGSEQTGAMIRGEKMAPWENPETSGRLLKRCGHLRQAVLALLDRDPSKRPSMKELHRACKGILSHTTTTPT